MNLNRESIYKKAIAFNGEFMQKVVAIEELSELQKELTKDLRDSENRKHIVEEMSDVTIMLEQLKLIYKVSQNELDEEIDYKLVRLMHRINDELEE